MKVLFVESRTGGDFTMDAIWAGLVDKFGPDNVIDWPPKEKHREGVPHITGDVEKDYGAERRSLCYTPRSDLLPSYTVNEINDLLRSGQIHVVFVDERQETFEFYAKTIAFQLRIPVIVIAGHDRFWNDRPETLLAMYGTNLKAMFLDNWRENYRSLKNAFPMSYATNFDHLWDVGSRKELLTNKLYDICFMGYNSHGDRAKIVDHIVSKYGSEGNCLLVEKRHNTMDAFLPKNEYFKKIAQSRVCLNLLGAAECGKALRFYEIPYVGSFMLSQRFGGLQVHPYQAGIHCMYFEDIDDLDMKINWALSNPTQRETMASLGHEHAMKFHTARARVDYIYGCINGQS